MRRFEIRHLTRYDFSATVALAPHQLLLRPRPSADLAIESFSLTIDPPIEPLWTVDLFDNAVATLPFDARPADRLGIEMRSVVRRSAVEPPAYAIAPRAALHPFAYSPEEAAILAPFFANASDRDLSEAGGWARRLYDPNAPIETLALTDRIGAAIPETLRYEVRHAEGVQTAADTLERGAGSCRDFANLMIEALRALGVAARFVSGYKHDASLSPELASTHAWVEMYAPGLGWRSWDPTAGGEAGLEHIPVAVARSPEDAPPVAGAFNGAGVSAEMTVEVSVVEL